MPVIDGEEVLGLFRQLEADLLRPDARRTPVIVTSSLGHEELSSRASLARGCDVILGKPIVLPELAAVLVRLGIDISHGSQASAW